MIKVDITPNVLVTGNATSYDEIWIEFTTHNTRENVFSDALGYSSSFLGTEGAIDLSCREDGIAATIDSNRILCSLWKGS